MTHQTLFIAALALISLAAIWGKRDTMDDWLIPTATSIAKPIQFDNGTIRNYGNTSDRSSSSGSPPVPPGTLRKCVKGQQVSYTNQTCPLGSNENPVAGPPVNVMPSQAAAKPETAQPSKTSASLRDALDVSRDENLRERAIERTVEGKR